MDNPTVEIGPITIDDNALGPQENPITIDTNGGSQVNLSDSDAATRAYKAALGTQKYGNYDYPSIRQGIRQGQEDVIRADTAGTVSLENQKVRNKLITEIAYKRGSSLTPEDVDLIGKNLDTLSVSDDPSSVLEELYARQHVQEVRSAAQRLDSQPFQQANEETPGAVKQVEQEADTLVARREFLLKTAKNMEHLVKDQPWVPYVADQLKQFFPGYYEFKMRANVPDVGFFDGGLVGENLEAQRQQLLSLPFPELKKRLTEITDKLKEDNPGLAYAFATSMLGKSTFDRYTENLNTVAEIAVDAPLLKAGVKGIQAVNNLRKVRRAYKDIVNAALDPEISKAAVTEATGDLETAAVKSAAQNITDEVGGVADPTKRAFESLPSILRLDSNNLGSNLGTASQNLVTQMEEQYTSFTNSLLYALKATAKIRRIPGVDDIETAIRQVYENTKKLYPNIRNNILDVSGPVKDRMVHEPITNTYHVAIDIGDLHGLLFTERHTAERWAHANGFTNYEIRDKGLGFFIRVYKPLDETQSIVRDLLLSTPGARDPESLLDMWGTTKGALRGLRTTEETLSEVHRSNRLIAAYTPAVAREVMAREAKEIAALASGRIERDLISGDPLPRFQRYKLSPVDRKNRWEDFKRVVAQARDIPDPDNNMLPGYFFKDNAELDYSYMKTVGRLPDAYERRAYFAFKRLAEGDRMMRNIAVYRNKVRQGVETHNVKFADDTGKLVDSADFDGARRGDFPVSDVDSILLIDEGGSTSQRVLSMMSKKQQTHYRKEVKEGRASVIELYDPENKPLQAVPGAGNSRIRYVLSYNTQSKPLSFEQVPRRGGGHFDYDYDLYIKQAKINPAYDKTRDVFKHWYEGDTTVMPIAIRSMGKDIMQHLENVRLALKDGDIAGARRAAKELPIEWKEVHSWFLPQKDMNTGIINPARLSVDEPFRLISKNAKIADVDNELPLRYRTKDGKSTTFIDGTKHGSMARQGQVEYTGKRDADMVFTINNEGTKYNPIFKWERANMIDPIASMTRAITKISNSNIMDDYKIFAYENWLQHAKNYIKDPLSAQTSPFWTFNHGEYLNNIDAATRNRLETSRKRIKQFIGIANPLEATNLRISQTLADSIYNKLGNNGILLAATDKLADSTLLNNPAGAIRSFVFHTTLGLFNISQVLTQMQTYANIYALSPRGAHSVTSGALATVWARVNKDPRWMEQLDKKLSMFQIPGMRNWKPGQFTESMDLLDRSGFGIVQGEYASLDRVIPARLVPSAGGALLEGGTWFFKAGEKMTRFGAWHASYLEFREANPLVKIGNKEMHEIQQRADLLYGNMSRASSSALHEGPMSVIAQFAAYQIRQVELFTGKRLTAMDRARLFVTHAVLYGGIGAAGLTGLPLADYLRKAAMDHGYVVGDNWLESLGMEGGISTLLAMITGGGDPHKGTYYNVGDRWALQGLTQIQAALRTDTPMIQVMTGAFGSKVANILYDTDPYWRMVKGFMGMSGFSSNPDDPKFYPPTADELIDMLKEVGSVNKTIQLGMALHTANWISKRDSVIESGVSPYDALWRYISGLQSQDASDGQLMMRSLNDDAERQRYGLKRFVSEYQKGMRSADEDKEAANKYFQKAFSWLVATGWTLDKYDQALSAGNRGVQDLVTRAKFDYYIRKANPENADVLSDAFERAGKLNERKGK